MGSKIYQVDVKNKTDQHKQQTHTFSSNFCNNHQVTKCNEPEETLDFSAYTASEELNINMESPTKEELDKTINLLKQNKATLEIPKDGGQAVRE